MRNHDTGEEQETGHCGWRESRELRHGWHEADLGLVGLSGQAMATGATASPELATQQQASTDRAHQGSEGDLEHPTGLRTFPVASAFPGEQLSCICFDGP